MGPVPVKDEIARLLADCRGRAGVTAPPELDADELHGAEAGETIRFAEDILALFAAHVPRFEEIYEMRVSRIVAHTAALRDLGLRGDLVAIGRHAGPAWEGVTYFCVEKGRQGPTRLVIVDGETRATRAVLLADWLAAELQTFSPATESPPVFEPRLVRRMAPGSPGQRVRHKVFGEGRVSLETGTGPTRVVKVIFHHAGIKLVQARFLEFLD